MMNAQTPSAEFAFPPAPQQRQFVLKVDNLTADEGRELVRTVINMLDRFDVLPSEFHYLYA